MAYLEARSGIARSGVTHAGWTPPNVQLLISGVNRIDNVDGAGFRITRALDAGSSTCQLTLCGYVPTFGERVLVTYATPDEYLFAGTILQAQAVPRGSTEATLWQCTAVGDTWLLDRYARVTKRYDNVGAGTIVADILANYTDGGFRVDYVPESLGNLSVEFSFEPVSSAIDRIAKALDCYWDISAARNTVSVYDTYPDAALFPITDDPDLRIDSYRGDLTQIRTRVLVQGKATQTSTIVPAGAAVVPVQDTSIFQSAGLALAGQSLITYTGRSTLWGPGNLTGVTGLGQDLAASDAVAIVVQEDDAPAQGTLAAALGGGLSGIATHVITSEQATAAEASERAKADLAVFKSALTEITYTTVSESHRHVKVGRQQTIALTEPIAVSDVYRVQSVTIVPITATKGRVVNLSRQVSLSRFRRSLTSILRRAA